MKKIHLVRNIYNNFLYQECFFVFYFKVLSIRYKQIEGLFYYVDVLYNNVRTNEKNYSLLSIWLSDCTTEDGLS